MDYNDNQISSPEEFALLAKEYSNTLNKIKKAIETDCVSLLHELCCIYQYIIKNVKQQKILSIFVSIKNQTLQDIQSFENNFPLNLKKNAFNKIRYNNLRLCLKKSIKLEIELITNIVLNNLDPCCNIVLSRLEILKNLSSLI